MRVNILVAAATLLLGLVFGQSVTPDPNIPMTLQSVSRVMNFTSNYSMEYFTHNLGGVAQVRFILRLRNYNISTWTT